MANSFLYKKETFKVGDTISLKYLIKEGDKQRAQTFKGILIKIKGATPETKMITIRKISRSGIGVERIIPLSSPYLSDIKLIKKGNTKKAKLYFIRNLSDAELRRKIYRQK
ncbi:MAG: 50S ribosomal protein L19 [Patescibacteria group bacterium]|nr:50S ribosomal protein L19 [Patescibacteria group bacterium]